MIYCSKIKRNLAANVSFALKILTLAILSSILINFDLFAQAITPTPTPVPPKLGSGTLNGELIIEAFHDGSYKLAQVISGSPSQRLDPTFNRSGSVLHSDALLGCGLGFQNSFNSASFSQATPINNVLAGNSITTNARCYGAPGVEWQQTIEYDVGNTAGIRWSITNNSSSNISNLRFYHIMNANAGSGLGATNGFTQSSLNRFGLINVTTSTTTNLNTISFQSFIPPNRFFLDQSSFISTSIIGGVPLNGGIATNTPSLNSIALEWEKSTLTVGETWVIGGVVQSINSTVNDDLFIIPPAAIEILAGETKTVPFLLGDAGPNSKTVTTLTPTLTGSASGWTSNVTVPSTLPFTLPISSPLGSNLETIQVEVSAPASAAIPSSNEIELSASAGGNLATDKVKLFVVGALATPTPLPTEKPVKITFPYISTGPLTPTIPGTAFPGSQVSFFIDEQLIAETSADVNGNWAVALKNPLTIGPHFLAASATDPLTRKSDHGPIPLYATGGADGDFEGDGYTDLTTYQGLGSSIVYRLKTSSKLKSEVAYVKGAVPSAADYDGDGITDFAAIGRSGKSFLWSATLSSTDEKIEDIFGVRGDTLVTGCRFTSAALHSLVALRNSDLFYRDIFSDKVEKVDNIIPSGSSFIGCADINADGIDELILSSGNSTKNISAIRLDKTSSQLKSTSAFSKAFVMRMPKDRDPILLLVRAESAIRRTIEPLALLNPSNFDKVKAPRKLIVGSALVRDESVEAPSKGYFFQDIKSGKVTGYLLGDTSAVDSLATISRGSRVVLPQYIYSTR